MADVIPPADFEWTHFFELAQELGQRDNEAAQRCAVSRSYYAVFHTAKLVLERIDPEFASMHSQDSHKQVWDRLATLNQRQAKNALRKSRSLLHARRDADYRLQAGDWPRRTQAALHDAEQALSSLAELRREAQVLSGSVYIETPRMSSRTCSGCRSEGSTRCSQSPRSHNRHVTPTCSIPSSSCRSIPSA